MNTQTELLNDNTARLTVEVEPERLEKAKQTAAQKLAKRLNIPGFRKGKAPYRVVLSYVGEGAIIEDAVEELGNQVYREALEQSDLDPYGPGQLEDVNVEEAPKFIFVVPLQPSVDLGDYRSLRVDYTAANVEDEAVNRALRLLQEQEAVVEESHRGVAIGDRITAFIDGRLISETTETGDDADEDHEHAEGDGHHHYVDENTIIHEHEGVISLAEDSEPAPGFAKALEGATVGERRVFELTYPDDPEEYEDLAGKRAKFDVTIQKIETVTLPALNDDFAARVTNEEEKPLTLLELRMRVRENLQRMADQNATSEYARQAVDKLVENATIHYPEAMVADQVEQLKRRFDHDLRQRGLTVQDYMRIYKKSEQDLYDEFREPAVKAIERALVMMEISQVEGLEVTPEDVQAEIDRAAEQFGERADDYRKLFNEPTMQRNVYNDLLNQRTMERIAAIAKGEAPELAAPTTELSESNESTGIPSEERSEAEGESVEE